MRVNSLPVLINLCLISSFAEASILMNKVREQRMTVRASTTDLRGPEATRSRSMIISEYLQDVLVSIDEKLRNLDTYTNPLKLAKLDFSLEQMGRKLENIETKLGRMETKFDLRMAKVEDIVEGKDLKEEFSNSQLVRQMDNLNEKFNNKFGAIDAKVERLWKKMDELQREFQSVSDDVTERLIKLDERQTQISFKLDEIKPITDSENTRLIVRDEIKRNGVAKLTRWMDDNLVNDTRNLRIEVQKLKSEIFASNNLIKNQTDFILDSVEFVKDNCSGLNHSYGRSRSHDEYYLPNIDSKDKIDNISTILHRTVRLNEAKFKELDEDLESYSRKVLNGIKESSDKLKGLMFDVSQEGNATRQIIRSGLDELHDQMKPVSNMEPVLGENLNRRLYELSETVDNKFSILLTAQNRFIDSCRRIQEEESQIYEALGHVVNEVRDRSESDMETIVKNLNNQSDFLAKNLDAIMMAILTSSNETAHRIVDVVWNNRGESISTTNRDCDDKGETSNHIDQMDFSRSLSTSIGNLTENIDNDDKSGTKSESGMYDREFDEQSDVLKPNGKILDYDQDYQMHEADYSDS